MEFRLLKYFLAVFEEGRFGAAARRLRITQPPLSRAIRRLEGELGVLLFERSRASVTATPAAQAFAAHARKILADVESSTDYMRRKHGQGGRLSIGYVHTANLRLLPRLLKAFCRLHPEIEIRLNPLRGEEQIQALRDARIDVGILRLPVTAAGLRVESLLDEATVVALPEGHPLSRLLKIGPGALYPLPVFLLDRASGPLAHPSAKNGDSCDSVCPKLLLETGDVSDHLGLIAAGIGASYLPESITDVRRKGVIYRRLHPPVPAFRLGIAYRKGRRSREQRAFLSIARRLCPVA